jgi:hypothetical protein
MTQAVVPGPDGYAFDMPLLPYLRGEHNRRESLRHKNGLLKIEIRVTLGVAPESFKCPADSY